jgi:hypothetical protein
MDYVESITFMLQPGLVNVIFGEVSNQCPQRPPLGNSPTSTLQDRRSQEKKGLFGGAFEDSQDKKIEFSYKQERF